MKVSHQIGEALWARYKPNCPDLNLKVQLEPEIRCYVIGVRTLMLSRIQETYYICTVAMKTQELSSLICEVFDEVDRDLKKNVPVLTDHHA